MVTLEIAGIQYTGWTDVTIERTMTDISGSFEFTMTDGFREQEKPDISAGTLCRITDNGVVLKEGYIDRVTPTFDQSGISYTVTGRDRAADLVDCGVNNSTNEWKNINFQEIINNLVSPFGIQATFAVTSDRKFETVTWDDGTQVFEVIRKYAEKLQLLVYSGLAGQLIINRVSTERAPIALQEGENILSANGASDMSNVFSEYIVIGDRQSTTNITNEEEILAKQSVKDETVGRYRPIVIIQEGATDSDIALARARWEATTRLALKEAYVVNVQGWYPDVNQLINLNSQTLGVNNKDMLIAGVELILSAAGKITRMKLVPPETFTPLPSSLITDEDIKSKYTGRSVDEVLDIIEQEERERAQNL